MAALAEYLKKYTADASQLEKSKKKKKKAKGKPSRDSSGGLRIVDADVKWQKDTRHESEEDEEEAPIVEESAEVKGMQQLERAKMHRPYLTIGEDGSGWVTVDDSNQQPGDSTEASPGPSPPRKRPAPPSPPSPPRRRQRHDSEDLSPPTKGAGRGSDTDLSPPRKSHPSPPQPQPSRKRQPSPPSPSPSNRDLSPLRKPRMDTDLSPPRRGSGRVPIVKREREPEGDLSPPRKRVSSSGNDDLSPPRRGKGGEGGKKLTSAPPPARMSDGTLAGLRSGKEVGEELRGKREEDLARFRSMDATVMGRGAGTVYRDKQGKKSSLEEIMEEERARKKKDLPPPVWGKGLVQQRKTEREAAELEEEAARPFAQYRDDPRLDANLKAAVRWGDPMAHLVKSKNPGAELADLSMNALLVGSGFKIPQEIPPHSWLKRGIQAPLNRWGILPGRHWDGVDRSNGFEKEAFLRKNESEATQKEAYAWSVAEM